MSQRDTYIPVREAEHGAHGVPTLRVVPRAVSMAAVVRPGPARPFDRRHSYRRRR